MPPQPPRGAATPSGLLGRTAELRAIADVLDADTGLLAMVGEPGIGETALPTAAIRLAGDRGWRVLSAIGVRAEAHYPFAGLHQI